MGETIKFDIFNSLFKNSGLKKIQIARTFNVSATSVQAWFDRESIPTKYLYPIADLFDVSTDFLVGKETNVPVSGIPSLGEKIKQARKAKGITQDKLAEKLGINRVAISNYEKGINNPTFANLTKLSTILGVELLGCTEKTSKTIPLIGLASGGIPQEFDLNNYEELPIRDKFYKARMYAVEAESNNMAPKINNGDIVYCSQDDGIQNGSIVHYTYKGESGIKKYEVNEAQNTISLIPLDPDYEITIIDKVNMMNLRMSKVVGVFDSNF